MTCSASSWISFDRAAKYSESFISRLDSDPRPRRPRSRVLEADEPKEISNRFKTACLSCHGYLVHEPWRVSQAAPAAPTQAGRGVYTWNDMVHELTFELGHKGSRWPVAVAVTDSGCHIPAVGPSALACLRQQLFMICFPIICWIWWWWTWWWYDDGSCRGSSRNSNRNKEVVVVVVIDDCLLTCSVIFHYFLPEISLNYLLWSFKC